jgi:hypothetical protein
VRLEGLGKLKKKITSSGLDPAAIRLVALFIYLFLLFGLGGYWHCGHSWPIVPASGDSEDDYGEADGM